MVGAPATAGLVVLEEHLDLQRHARERIDHRLENRPEVRVQQALTALWGSAAAIRRMRVVTEIGLAHWDLGGAAQARAALEQALDLSERLQTHAGPDRADILSGLARVRLAEGDRCSPCSPATVRAETSRLHKELWLDDDMSQIWSV